MEHEQIYQSLLKRDAREKFVNITKMMDVNDKLVKLVHELKTEIDNLSGMLEQKSSKLSLCEQKNQSLTHLVTEKDTIIRKLMIQSDR